MSITTYIHKLKEELDISYMQLAKDIDISYQNMMDLKNNRISFVSPTVLKKLAKYENRTQDDILFDILRDDVEEEYSLLSLKYICDKYLQGYSITINPNIPNPFMVGNMTFDGFILKKRTGNNYIAVDSWQKIKREHWKIFKASSNIPFSKDAFTHVFLNQEMYLANVISWAVQRIMISDDNAIKGYDILFDKNLDNDDYHLVINYLLNYSGFKVQLLLK